MLKFYNIKSGETRVAETEPMISAFWGSSDRGPNAMNGQDFGWRLAPETVVEVRRLQADPEAIRNIAIGQGIIPESVSESDILKYISDRADKSVTGMDQTEEDFKAKYEAEISAIEAKVRAKAVEETKPTKKETK